MKNALVYAYLGDAIYEFYIRKYLIDNNISKVKDLTKGSMKYVSAVSQRKILEFLLDKEFLKEDELEIIRWGRNAKGTRAKHADIITYRYATALECLFGYLYYEKREDRINEIMNFILDNYENN